MKIVVQLKLHKSSSLLEVHQRKLKHHYLKILTIIMCELDISISQIVEQTTSKMNFQAEFLRLHEM